MRWNFSIIFFLFLAPGICLAEERKIDCSDDSTSCRAPTTTSDPLSTLGTADRLALGTTVKNDNTEIAIAVAPFHHLNPTYWWAQSFQLKLKYDSDKEGTEVGMFYRIDPRLLNNKVGSETWKELTNDWIFLSKSAAEKFKKESLPEPSALPEIAENIRDLETLADSANTKKPLFSKAVTQVADYLKEHKKSGKEEKEKRAEHIAVLSALASALSGELHAPHISLIKISKPLNLIRQTIQEAKVDGSYDKQETDRYRKFVKKLYRTPTYLLPTFVVGYSATLSKLELTDPPDGKKLNRRMDTQHTITGGLSFRWGVFVELDPLAKVHLQRSSSVDDPDTDWDETDAAQLLECGVTAVVVLPWLLGTKPYDDYYIKHGFQRGLALGASYNHVSCLEDGEQRVKCPESNVSSSSYSGSLELRLDPKIRPGLKVGYTHKSVYRPEAQETGESGIDVVGSLLFSL